MNWRFTGRSGRPAEAAVVGNGCGRRRRAAIFVLPWGGTRFSFCVTRCFLLLYCATSSFLVSTIPMFKIYKFSKFQSFKVPKFQSFEISTFQNSQIRNSRKQMCGTHTHTLPKLYNNLTSPKINSIGFGAQGHVRKCRNHRNDGVEGSHITKSESYKFKLEQNNTTELSSISIP